jgi:hypothetical protein
MKKIIHLAPLVDPVIKSFLLQDEFLVLSEAVPVLSEAVPVLSEAVLVLERTQMTEPIIDHERSTPYRIACGAVR